ncbi:MAG: hypothetical protein ACYYKD_01730 [Rhodospirillales bacterium]
MAGWPMNEHDWNRFGVSHFARGGHHVEIANLADWIHPRLEKPWDEEVRSPDTPIHYIAGVRDLLRFRHNIKRFDAVIVLLQSAFLMSRTWLPYILLARSNLPYLVLGPSVYPGFKFDVQAVPLRRRLRDLAARLKDMNPVNSVLARLPAGRLGVGPAAVVLKPSENSQTAPVFTGPGTKVLHSCTDDYENVARLRRRTSERKAQAVFIDQHMPHHQDFKELNAQPINADAYYDCLRRYFDRFEAATGLQTVIAAHPRASVDELRGAFNGRPVFKGRTAELISESRAVFGHNSTALGAAAALRTPVVLLATKPIYFYQTYEKYCYEMFSRELGAPLIFIDDPETALVPPLPDLTVNEDLCAAYERRYLRCEGAPETPRWAAVESALHEVLAA